MEKYGLLRLDAYFYPRSPCGERRHIAFNAAHVVGISIHALLAESDVSGAFRIVTTSGFLSTLSLRRATARADNHIPHQIISIHALLAESDVNLVIAILLLIISIHALLAESDIVRRALTFRRLRFLSTLSLRRATVESLQDLTRECISIHALLAESD